MRIVLALLLSFWIYGSAAAQSDADRVAIQSTIEGQLQAFLADDAATAYSFAAPGIKAMFPTKEIFMEMVRQGYRPVYRPRSYSFGELKVGAAGPEQLVDIVDANGDYWTAHYTLALVDGEWRITGCYLEEKPGVAA